MRPEFEKSRAEGGTPGVMHQETSYYMTIGRMMTAAKRADPRIRRGETGKGIVVCLPGLEIEK